jgi:hypothetical protein
MAPICSLAIITSLLMSDRKLLQTNLIEKTIDTNNFRVIFLNDFNAPFFFNWVRGSSLYLTVTIILNPGETLYSAGLLTADSRNLLDLAFANFPDLMPIPTDSGLVKPDVYHPPLIIHTYFQHFPKNSTSITSYRNFAAGNYTLQFCHCVRLDRAV